MFSNSLNAQERAVRVPNVSSPIHRSAPHANTQEASADRRPVDPPPIVELRVFEGENEITFSYNASFFLFATLENARTIAQGRVAQGAATFPVLTGTPVAGMAYLDRPSPAGYFIFPDLSVRHEGKYRLSFALYEELKDAKDMDGEDQQPVAVHSTELGAHVSHRLEVKSAPFTVFSAKKFPGLAESTALSRMVAEQGCRVRIRRDVRMRRRDNKASKDWDEYDEQHSEHEYARRTATPDAYGQASMPAPQPPMDGSDRPRSVSNASNASFGIPQRRPSLHETVPGYQQQGYPPHIAPQTPQSAYAPQAPPFYPAQQQQSQAQYQPVQQTMMQPPQIPMQQSHYIEGNYMPSSYFTVPPQQPTQSRYEPMHHTRNNSMEYPPTPTDYRRPSAAQPQPTQFSTASQMMATQPFGTLDASYGRPFHVTQPPQQIPTPASMHSLPPNTTVASTNGMNGHPLAPLKTLQPPMDKSEPSSPYGMPGPMNGHVDIPQCRDPNDALKRTPPKFPSPTETLAAGSTKRTFSSTFGLQDTQQPMRQGARPSGAHAPDHRFLDGMGDDADDIQQALAEDAMSYRRADGTERRRRVPLSD